MLTRITRYTLLVLCLLVAGAWGWSLFFVTELNNPAWNSWYAELKCGTLRIGCSSNKNLVDYHITLHRQTVIGLNAAEQFGLQPPFAWSEVHGFAAQSYDKGMILPLWSVFVPALTTTAALWYRPIRNRLRPKRDAGFEVEVKDDKVTG